MQSEKSYSAANMIFAILVAFLLASVLAPAWSQAQQFKVLHTFHGKDGAFPIGLLVRDAAGNFYGTTNEGGKGCTYFNGCGTAFKLDKTGKQIWVHTFNLSDGTTPYAGLLRGRNGTFYGTTSYGGDTSCFAPYGCGTVFKLDKNGRETLLYAFKGRPDGQFPEALLIEDSAGNLRGTTPMGGESDLGTVFKLDAAGKETILYNFKGPIGGGGDGAYPGGGVIRDSAGNLYGGTEQGGGDGDGAVFEVDTNGNETLLYSFNDGLDGAFASAVLLMDSAGNLYGTTQDGGYAVCGYHCGSAYELSPVMGGWKEKTLYTFCSLTNCEDGEEPMRGPLVRDKHGNFYGTTYDGGKYICSTNGVGCGVVFKLDGSGKETVIHNFTGGADGAYPFAGLTMDNAGNLYGTAAQGGDLKCAPGNGQGCGTVFEITP
jgi:uncharacterized repeat protein (TIGR03803 family)